MDEIEEILKELEDNFQESMRTLIDAKGYSTELDTNNAIFDLMIQKIAYLTNSSKESVFQEMLQKAQTKLDNNP